MSKLGGNINRYSDTKTKSKNEINNSYVDESEKYNDSEKIISNNVEENECGEFRDENIRKEKTKDDTTTADISNEELIKQLKVLNLSIDTLYVVLLGISLNINYLKGEKVKLLDAINKSNLSEGLPDLSKTNRITSIMFLYSSGIFLDINYKAFKEASSLKGNKRDAKLVRRTWKSYLAALLTFIASGISRDNLEP